MSLWLLINSPIINKVEHIFLHLSANWFFLFCEVLLQVFCPSFYGMRLPMYMNLIYLCY